MRLRDMSEASTPPPGYGTFHSECERLTESNSINSGAGVDELRILLDRDVLTQASLEKLSDESHTSHRFTFSDDQGDSKKVCSTRCKAFVSSLFPVVGWLSTYKFRESLLTDIVAGFTLGVMQVPQGMAYAMLAGVAPVLGLYTSFYPVLVYFFLGTSKQASIGTFALVSILTSSAMEEVLKAHRGFPAPNLVPPINGTSLYENNTTQGDSTGVVSDLDPADAAVVVAMVVGVIDLAMGITRMGCFTVLMSDHMISGLITGTAIQVLTSQLPSLTGAPIPKHTGAFNLIYTWIDFFRLIPHINLSTLLVSTSSLLTLGLIKFLVDPPCKKYLKVPFPSELMLIILGTVCSQKFSFETKFNIDVIGPIPTGLIGPRLPRLDLVPGLFTGSVIVAIVGVSLSLSIVMAYAKKHDYPHDPNQELLAYGVANLVGSFFSCIPCSVSLSRSAVLDSSGAKSLISTLVSCILILIVILVLGPLFKNLPDAVLSAIIVVALRSMLLGVGDGFRAWKTSKTEAAIWMVTCLGVLILDIDYGLAVGILFSLSTVVYKSQHPDVHKLGHIPGTEFYRDPHRYSNARDIPGVRVIHLSGAIYFGNRDALRSQVFSMLGKRVKRKDFEEYINDDSGHQLEQSWCSLMKNSAEIPANRYRQDILPSAHHIVLACSGVPFVDAEGAQAIIQLAADCQLRQVQVFFAHLQDPVLESLCAHGFMDVVPREFVFPSIHDAVLAAIDAAVNSDNIRHF